MDNKKPDSMRGTIDNAVTAQDIVKELNTLPSDWVMEDRLDPLLEAIAAAQYGYNNEMEFIHSVTNPYSNRSCKLSPVAYVVYSMLLQTYDKLLPYSVTPGVYSNAEMKIAQRVTAKRQENLPKLIDGMSVEFWRDFYAQGISWFREYYADEYFTLLD
tara:strand:- start:970 stop:1443 length:474 start_codon:yes stop_codon:yes gene_type:complete